MTTTFVIEIDWDNNGTWINESAHLRHAIYQIGMPADLFDCAAAPGTCTLTLDNSARRFSPDYAAGPLYGKLLPRRPLRIRAISGIANWTIFRGFIDSIAPESGVQSKRRAVIVAVDAIALLKTACVGLPLRTGKRADELIAELVNLAYTPPATSYQTGLETYTFAADRWSSDYTPALDAIRDCAASEFGRFFIQRDGAPTFLNRAWFLTPAATSITFDNAALTVEIARDADLIYNVINVIMHPRDVTGPLGVIARTAAPATLGAGATRTIRLRFRDPVTGQPCGGQALVTPLVAYTDYAINTAKDGTGTDYTVSTSISLSVAAVNGAEIALTFTNNAAITLYVTALQVRGKPITRYQPVTATCEDSTSQAAYQRRALTLDLPLPTDSAIAETLAVTLLNACKQPATRPHLITIHNRDTVTTGGINLFSLKLYDTVAVSDAQTGLNAVPCWITGQRVEITPKGYTIRLVVERSDRSS